MVKKKSFYKKQLIFRSLLYRGICFLKIALKQVDISISIEMRVSMKSNDSLKRNTELKLQNWPAANYNLRGHLSEKFNSLIREDMNSSTASHGEEIPPECTTYNFLGGKLDHTTTEAYAVLVFIAVMSVITCPITTVLNVLVIIAVKTKPRLKIMSNIALACLAATDGLMRMIGLPLFITAIISRAGSRILHE